jgi:hypothetical protein
MGRLIRLTLPLLLIGIVAFVCAFLGAVMGDSRLGLVPRHGEVLLYAMIDGSKNCE